MKNVHSAVKDISDLDLQRKAWLGEADECVSSFEEMINILYDDNCFEDFIGNEAWSKSTTAATLHQELVRLRDMIDAYEEPETNRQILDDLRWKKITKQAKKVIDIWNHSSIVVSVEA